MAARAKALQCCIGWWHAFCVYFYIREWRTIFNWGFISFHCDDMSYVIRWRMHASMQVQNDFLYANKSNDKMTSFTHKGVSHMNFGYETG